MRKPVTARESVHSHLFQTVGQGERDKRSAFIERVRTYSLQGRIEVNFGKRRAIRKGVFADNARLCGKLYFANSRAAVESEIGHVGAVGQGHSFEGIRNVSFRPRVFFRAEDIAEVGISIRAAAYVRKHDIFEIAARVDRAYAYFVDGFGHGNRCKRQTAAERKVAYSV